MKVGFFGDFFGSETTVSLPFFGDTNLNFINLETPITESCASIPKAGPNLRGKLDALDALCKSFGGKIFFNLANNHIGDCGERGIIDTVNNLNKFPNVSYGGVSKGNDISAVKIPDTNYAVICMCERQFGISQPNRLGANHLTAEVYSHIRKSKLDGCKVVVSTHCAEEMNQWPSLRMQTLFRSFIDAGADIVYNTHSHVPCGFENYGGGAILYGMGNFVMNYNRWAKMSEYSTVSIEYIVENSNVSRRWLRMAGDGKLAECAEIPDYISDCNNPLGNPAQLEALWQEYSVREFENTYSKWINPSLFMRIKRIAKSIIRRDPSYARRIDLLLKYHLWSCESHREAIECALGVLSGELEDLRDKSSSAMLDKYYRK